MSRGQTIRLRVEQLERVQISIGACRDPCQESVCPGRSVCDHISIKDPLLPTIDLHNVCSFALAGSLILIAIGLFMRSLRAALAAILPNLLPIFCVFAVMTLLDIPFDTATVMIASVAIGIAAADTVHFLAHYKEEKQCRRGSANAVVWDVRRTVARVVKPSI